jgi:hypothetical protein
MTKVKTTTKNYLPLLPKNSQLTAERRNANTLNDIQWDKGRR